MSEVWFVRHGESFSNANAVVRDTATVELTDLGHQQAKDVSVHFDRQPDLIVATPYIRTQQTAHYTQLKFPDASREIWPLHEFDCLSHEAYRDTTQDTRNPLIREYWEKMDPHYVHGPGAEAFADMVARVSNGLERLTQRDEKFIAVFCHGHIMRVVRLLLAQPDISVMDVMHAMATWRMAIENCQIVKVSRAQGRLHLSNDDLVLLKVSMTEAGVYPHSKYG